MLPSYPTTRIPRREEEAYVNDRYIGIDPTDPYAALCRPGSVVEFVPEGNGFRGCLKVRDDLWLACDISQFGRPISLSIRPGLRAGPKLVRRSPLDRNRRSPGLGGRAGGDDST